ncbi:MAG: alpha/beta hydrolase [Planctomycetota bacterium]
MLALRPALRVAAVATTFLALPWCLWARVPAPTLELWYIAALVNERRVLVVLVLLVAFGVDAATARRRRTWGLLARGALVLLAVASSAELEVRAWRGAREAGVELDAAAYLTAPFDDVGEPAATLEFARAEGRPLLADLWLPATTAGPRRPAVVRVHGGSWAFGERSESPHLDRFLTDLGFVVFDVDYRLVPPPRWRDAVVDVRTAVAWVRANAARFDVDPERVVLMGSSAGAHLALVAAFASNDGPFAVEGDASVAAVVAISPPVDLTIGFTADYPWWTPSDLRSTRRVEDFVGGTPDELPERYRVASPLGHVTAGSPRTFLAHGARDLLVWPENSRRLAAALEAHGVEHELLLLPACDHLFERAAGGWGTQVLEGRLEAFLVDGDPLQGPSSSTSTDPRRSGRTDVR